jgi:hypothetical protein
MRRSLAVLLTTLLAWAIAPLPGSPASASCVGPQVDGTRIVLTHEGVQTVTGQYFHDGCDDEGKPCKPGCGCQDDDAESSSTDVELRITQPGRSWTLGKVDADDDGGTTWSFRLPAGVHPGPAKLIAEGASSVEVRIR